MDYKLLFSRLFYERMHLLIFHLLHALQEVSDNHAPQPGNRTFRFLDCITQLSERLTSTCIIVSYPGRDL